MRDLKTFREKLRELYRGTTPFDDNRKATQQDLADAIGLSRVELNIRLNGTKGAVLTNSNVRTIVRTLAEWGAITTRREAIYLLNLMECPLFATEEWEVPPLDSLMTPVLDESAIKFASTTSTKKEIRHNLPTALNSFVGRTEDLAELKQLLVSKTNTSLERIERTRIFSATRLISLTGTGGSGKTRLAVEVAKFCLNDFPGGVWLVELAPLVTTQNILQTIAATLAVSEQPHENLLETVKNAIGDNRLLLLLDNCEHLLKAVAQLAEQLLATCPQLYILVTSREILRVTSETCYMVKPLGLPASTTTATLQDFEALPELKEWEAINLFVHRAKQVQPNFKLHNENFDLVIKICRDLEGIPLALELAAARLKLLTLEQIYNRLRERFRVLGEGSNSRLVPDRQQTLYALVDWSYDLLDPLEKQVFQQLAVFVGTWSLEAAESIIKLDNATPVNGEKLDYKEKTNGKRKKELLDILAALVDKSLIQVNEIDSGKEKRFSMLETLRQYAQLRLAESNYSKQVYQRYAVFYLVLTQRAERKFIGPEQPFWLSCLESERYNLQAALTWLVEEPGINYASSALQMSVDLGSFWEVRSYISEGLQWLQAALSNYYLYLENETSELMAKSYFWLGKLTALQGGNSSQAKNYLEQSLQIWRDLEYMPPSSPTQSSLRPNFPMLEGEINKPSAASSNNILPLTQLVISSSPDLLVNKILSGQSQALIELGSLQHTLGNNHLALIILEEGLQLAHQLNDKPTIATALNYLATLAYNQGNYKTGYELAEQSLNLWREYEDKRGIAQAFNNLGLNCFRKGEFEQAQSFYQESLLLKQELGDKRGVASALTNLGNIAYLLGNHTNAKDFHTQALKLYRLIGNKRGLASGLNNLGLACFGLGDYALAQKYYEESLILKRLLEDKRGIAVSLENLGLVALTISDFEAAQRIFQESLALREELGDKAGISNTLNSLGSLAFMQADYRKAAVCYEESLMLRQQTSDKYGMANSFQSLGQVSFMQADFEKAYELYSQSLKLALEILDKPNLIDSLVGLAGVIGLRENSATAMSQQSWERAGLLYGMAMGIIAQEKIVLDPQSKFISEHVLKRLEQELDGEILAKCLKEGENLYLDQESINRLLLFVVDENERVR